MEEGKERWTDSWTKEMREFSPCPARYSTGAMDTSRREEGEGKETLVLLGEKGVVFRGHGSSIPLPYSFFCLSSSSMVASGDDRSIGKV